MNTDTRPALAFETYLAAAKTVSALAILWYGAETDAEREAIARVEAIALDVVLRFEQR